MLNSITINYNRQNILIDKSVEKCFKNICAQGFDDILAGFRVAVFTAQPTSIFHKNWKLCKKLWINLH